MPNGRELLIQHVKAEPALQSSLHNWKLHGRPDQQLPTTRDWQIWLILAGRGWGKTRTGAEGVHTWARTGKHGIIHLVGPTAADVRDVMVKGESGILAIAPKHERPIYSGSSRSLTWPNGVRALLFSAEEPDRLRGPQCHAAWADEVAAWKYPEAWDMLMFGLRLGLNPQCVATTTPKPTALIKDLVSRDGEDVYITKGSTYDNAINLAKTFMTQIIKKYEGTRLGRQELDAELLDDVPGALWTLAMLEAAYGGLGKIPEDFDRVVVAVDPSVTSHEESDETGIIVAGRKRIMDVEHGYVLDDLTMKGSPREWAIEAVRAYHHYKADRIVAEVNNGGEMVEAMLRQVDPNVAYSAVHACHGKRTRAEPVSALYEQRRIRHKARFGKLEDQMRTFNPETVEKSPDRVDALVWAFTELIIDPLEPGVFVF